MPAPAVDAAWSSAELANQVCNVLVANGHLKEKPAFIREDRQAKIAQIFEGVGLDGAKLASFQNLGPLEMCLRKGTNGEVWVAQVQTVLLAMLPEEVRTAKKAMGMDEATKEELAAAKEKTAVRRERMEQEQQNNPDERGAGKGRRYDGEDGESTGEGKGGGKGRGKGRRFDMEHGEGEDGGRGKGRGKGRFDMPEDGEGEGRGKGRGKGPRREEMTCHNCGEVGHASRECPLPQKDRGQRRTKDRSAQQCFNCGSMGHRSRDCPEPQKQAHKDRDLNQLQPEQMQGDEQ